MANQRIKGTFLEGELVRLKVLTESDVLNSNWWDWFNDENITLFLQKHYFPNCPEAQLDFFNKEIKNSRDKLQLGLCEKGKDRLFGVVSLQHIDMLNRKAEISLVIGEKEYQHVKFSMEAMKLILTHGFYSLNLNRIYGGTIIKEWADLLCRTFHFKYEGTFRQDVFKNNRFNDVFVVALLKEEFKPQM